jgi:hypothetical protein
MAEQLRLFPLSLPLNPRSVVYFAHRRGFIKIGTTTNPWRRMRELKARILLALPGDETLERQLHRQFRTSQVAGEWFLPTPELAEYIKSNIPPEVAA